MIAVVCVYNSAEMFERTLAASLQAQAGRFELIALDNSGGRFSSAAQALNYGARRVPAGCDYIMFAHQDISFSGPSWLADAETMLGALPGLGVAGVAGNSRRANKLFSNITHGTPPRDAGQRIEVATDAMTVDECCAFVPRPVFDKHRFDEQVCSDWHLYMVEYCLRLKALGLGVYVLPVALHHLSLGSLGRPYFKALKKVLRVHGGRYPRIYTACGPWDARRSVYLQGYAWLARNKFYDYAGRLIASGWVPEWLQRKKRKRLRAEAEARRR